MNSPKHPFKIYQKNIYEIKRSSTQNDQKSNYRIDRKCYDNKQNMKAYIET